MTFLHGICVSLFKIKKHVTVKKLKLKETVIMKSKFFLLSLMITTFAFSFSAFPASKLCTNMLGAICDSEAAIKARDDKENYIRLIKKEIGTEASKIALQKIKEINKNNPNKKLSRDEADVIIYREIIKSANSRMRGLETIVTNSEIINYLKDYLKIAIDESSLQPTIKKNYKRIIDSVIIGNFSDFIKRTGLKTDYISQIGTSCGLSGLSVNAFATTLNGQRYVLICPGFQITMHETPSMQERIDNILFVLSHELGHHIDNSVKGINEEPYLPFLDCVFNNYTKALVKSRPIENYCKTSTEDLCKAQVVLSHAGEMIADMWANKVLAIYANDQQLSMVQTNRLLMRTYGNICGTQDEGIHPSGNFRIGIMLRLTPEISDYLSCDNSRIKVPACTLSGELKL